MSKKSLFFQKRQFQTEFSQLFKKAESRVHVRTALSPKNFIIPLARHQLQLFGLLVSKLLSLIPII